MTYQNLIDAYKQELNDLSNKLKTEMDLFYEDNKNSDDIYYTYKVFQEVFDNKIYMFNSKYSVSFPKLLEGTDFKLYSIRDSIEICSDLRAHYNNLREKLYSKFPPVDDFQENQNLDL